MPGSGLMDGDVRWTVIGAVLAIIGVVIGWTAVQGPLARLSQAVQVASAGPAVTSLPWRTSGSRSRWASASRRRTMSASSMRR